VRRSSKVTLVLLGVAALAGCSRSDETRNDIYASRDDCLADWGNKPEDCKPATQPAQVARGLWLGPSYPMGMGFWGAGWGGGWGGTSHSSVHSLGSASSSSSGSVSRGGFGSTGSAHSSGSSGS
jgi:hypothetical protein